MPDKNPFEKILELEGRLLSDRKFHEKETGELREELKSLKEQIEELIVVLEAFRSMAKLFGYFEKTVIFTAKVGSACALVYAAYRFGITELVKEIQKAGGK